MKSFISILKKIGSVTLAIVGNPIVNAGLNAFVPGYARLDGLFQSLTHSIIVAEENNPVGNGQLKAEEVKANFNASLATIQEVLALQNKVMSYDEALLQASIDAQVLAYNNMAKLKASFKIVDK